VVLRVEIVKRTPSFGAACQDAGSEEFERIDEVAFVDLRISSKEEEDEEF
jgi:hypothetical protein